MKVQSEQKADRSDRLIRARKLLKEAIEILEEDGVLIAAARAQHAYDSCDLDIKQH